MSPAVQVVTTKKRPAKKSVGITPVVVKKKAVAFKARPAKKLVAFANYFQPFIDGTPMDVVKRTREGVSSELIVWLSDYLEMSKVALYDAIGVSRSTMEGRISKKSLLSAAESDKALRVVKVLSKASDVLGDPEEARKWLRREIRSIGGVQPVTLLDTEAGYELVMDTLGRIEYGVLA